jgi:protein-S-isoprenylcysteine O-methyltransferase Ste14
MKERENVKFEVARKQVKKIKCFYEHLVVYLVFIPVIFMVRFYALPKMGIVSKDEGFQDWLNWNTYLIPLLWLVVLVIHAFVVFKFSFMQKWEDKKVHELLEKEEQKSRQRWD